jgi:hypothetical protein
MTIQDYLDLITSSWDEKPNFTAMVSQIAAIQVQIQNCLTSMIPIFDLDLPPVGDQLDILGQWVGISRDVKIPIAGVYFSWNEAATLGWDYGTWQPYNKPTKITQLPDDAYLTLIRAKIAANQWDGTTNGAYAIWDIIFPQFTILIQDYQNMTYAFAIIGGIVDSLTLALLTGGYIPLRPEGVRVREYFTATDSNPAFCFDTPLTSFVGGWNEASWLKETLPD